MRAALPPLSDAAAGRFSRLRRGTAEINVVPFIDITLVLLVVFMVGAPLAVQGVTVQLPHAAAADLPAAFSPVVVSVAADGSYRLSLSGRQQERNLGQIAGQLAGMAKHNSDLAVIVRADARVSYQAVAALLAQIRAAGVHRVGLETRPQSER